MYITMVARPSYHSVKRAQNRGVNLHIDAVSPILFQSLCPDIFFAVHIHVFIMNSAYMDVPGKDFLIELN